MKDRRRWPSRHTARKTGRYSCGSRGSRRFLGLCLENGAGRGWVGDGSAGWVVCCRCRAGAGSLRSRRNRVAKKMEAKKGYIRQAQSISGCPDAVDLCTITARRTRSGVGTRVKITKSDPSCPRSPSRFSRLLAEAHRPVSRLPANDSSIVVGGLGRECSVVSHGSRQQRIASKDTRSRASFGAQPVVVGQQLTICWLSQGASPAVAESACRC